MINVHIDNDTGVMTAFRTLGAANVMYYPKGPSAIKRALNRLHALQRWNKRDLCFAQKMLGLRLKCVGTEAHLESAKHAVSKADVRAKAFADCISVLQEELKK